MKRVLEPELMNDARQAAVYAGSDLDDAYYLFVWCFQKFFPDLEPEMTILDLGCGTAGIAVRLAKLFPDSRIAAVDGAFHMLDYGRKAVRRENLGQRVKLYQATLPDRLDLPDALYDVIVSNSFLHHLADPMVLWDALEMYGTDTAAVLVVDLIRPTSEKDVRGVIERYMPEAPLLLRQEMLSSLHAAFTMEEVASQIHSTGLTDKLSMKRISPFQFAVYGKLAERS